MKQFCVREAAGGGVDIHLGPSLKPPSVRSHPCHPGQQPEVHLPEAIWPAFVGPSLTILNIQIEANARSKRYSFNTPGSYPTWGKANPQMLTFHCRIQASWLGIFEHTKKPSYMNKCKFDTLTVWMAEIGGFKTLYIN